MSIVLVHGIPETASVWDKLSDRLLEKGYKDQVRLSPPGFGARIPEGFDATLSAYNDWLITQLEHFAEPVDLIGHDLGGGLTVMAAMARPDLLRSWASDAVGLFDPEYSWHRYAKVWQKRFIGEMSILLYRGQSVKRRAAQQTAMGMNADIAADVAASFNKETGQSILKMYRSVKPPVMAELGRNLEAAAVRPGLSIMPTADQAVGTDEQRRRSAERAGAKIAVLQGYRHWWMTEDNGRHGAAILEAFWASIGSSVHASEPTTPPRAATLAPERQPAPSRTRRSG